jgi:octaprenyl-diphosphate synthase
MHIQEAFDLIKEDIKEVEEAFRKNLSSEVYLIRKVGEYILSSGGKRFRPLMLLLSARLCAYGGSRHIPLAAVLEFIHTATLLHDDVVDNAALRRGNASANSLWGNSASVLIGDYLLSKAFYLAVSDGNIRIMDVLARTTTRMAEGEVLQLIRHSDPETTEEGYLDVITSKTAVLFSAACQVAAILGRTSEEKEKALASYGMDIGIAFQLMDDCLDYTAKDEDLGKAVGNDLREGKVTLPLIKAYRDSSLDEKEMIKGAVTAGEADAARLEEIMGLIKACTDRAKGQLEAFEPTIERAAMIAVADYVIERNH